MEKTDGVVDTKRLVSWSSMFPFDSAAIRLHEMAWVDAGPDFISQCRPGLDIVLFVYVLKGEGFVESEGSSSPLAQGQALLMNIKGGYTARSASKLWSFIWIRMSGSLANSLLSYINNERRKNCFDASAELLPVCSQIYELASAGTWSQYTDIELSYSLYHLLGILHSAPVADRQTQPAIDFIEEHYMDELTVDSLARLCLMSQYHFIRCFKREHGVTPHFYINLFRINKAKSLLLSTELPISVISCSVGFEDPSYFARLFKTHTGILPKDFRKLQ